MSANTITLRGLRLRGADDHALAASAAAGNSAAFAEIYRRYHTRVYAFCLSRLMDAAAADDATQEVFIRLLAASPQSIGALLPWLFGVARNVCVDVHRSTGRSAHTPLEDVGVSAESAECGAAQSEELERVALSLRRMSPRYRDVFVQSEIHERPASEIATTLRIQVGAAYTLLSRARDAFAASYNRVEQLPEACRMAARVMHEEATGRADAASLARLEMHVSACPECAKARRAAHRSARLAHLKQLVGLPFFARLMGGGNPWAVSRVAHPETALAVMNGTAALLVATTLVAGGAPTIPPAQQTVRTRHTLLAANHIVRADTRSAMSRSRTAHVARPARTLTRTRLAVKKRSGADGGARKGSAIAGTTSQGPKGSVKGSGAQSTTPARNDASGTPRGAVHESGSRTSSAIAAGTH